MRQVEVYEGVTRAMFEADIVPNHRPAILKGLVSDWPIVGRALDAPESLCAYLKSHDTGKPVSNLIAEAQLRGKYFYTDDLRGLNFKREPSSLSETLDWLLAHKAQTPLEATCASRVVQGVPTTEICPPFMAEHPMPLIDPRIVPRFWIGNAGRSQTHYDIMDNIACNVSGHRTFTLFPHDQLPNLYVGPFDVTPAGTPVSLPDVIDPDLERYPRFAQALEAALVAELEPGDALYIPYFWWHDVRSKGPLNMLVNYWWNPGREDLLPPYQAFYMALGTYAHMSPAMRQDWKRMFDHFIFKTDGEPLAHLPQENRGIFAEMPPRLMPRLHEFIYRTLGLNRK